MIIVLGIHEILTKGSIDLRSHDCNIGIINHRWDRRLKMNRPECWAASKFGTILIGEHEMCFDHYDIAKYMNRRFLIRPQS